MSVKESLSRFSQLSFGKQRRAVVTTLGIGAAVAALGLSSAYAEGGSISGKEDISARKIRKKLAKERKPTSREIAFLMERPRLLGMGNALVLAGEQGNYAGDILSGTEMTPEPSLTPERIQQLTALQRILERKEQETQGHIGIELHQGQWNFVATNKSGVLTDEIFPILIANQDRIPFEQLSDEEFMWFIENSIPVDVSQITEQQKKLILHAPLPPFQAQSRIGLETSRWLYHPESDHILVPMQASYLRNGHFNRQQISGGSLSLVLDVEQALDMAFESTKRFTSIAMFDAYGGNKRNNMWVGAFFSALQGRGLSHVSMLELTQLINHDYLFGTEEHPAYYVPWSAIVAGEEVKELGSGVCANNALQMNPVLRALEDSGVGYELESQGHSPNYKDENGNVIDLRYWATGNDPLMAIREGKPRNPVHDNTMFYDEVNGHRMDSSIALGEDTIVDVLPSVLRSHQSDPVFMMVTEARVHTR